jgi:hypothetical protein
VVRFAAGLVIAAGVALTFVRFYGEVPPGQNVEAAAGAIAFGAVFAAPGVLALLAEPDRPALLVPAAFLLIPLSFVSFALVTLPLLIPSYLLFRAYAGAVVPGQAWRTVGTTATVLVLLVAALVALFAHDDPRSWTTDRTSYSTSDVVTYIEAAASFALTTAAVAAGYALARPPRAATDPTGPSEGGGVRR